MKRMTAVAVLFGMSLATSEAATRYVVVSNAAAASPYTNWATAAAIFQNALDVAQDGDEVLVSNGVYSIGARVIGEWVRVITTNPVTIRSVNGPEVTVIAGSTSPHTRCAYLSAGSVLDGFTLQGALSDQPGCGVYCASTSVLVTNCIITGNASWREGGGVYGGTLVNCQIAGNTTVARGGGAAYSVLSNCFVSGNWAKYGGGGLLSSRAVDCRIEGNTGSSGAGAAESTLESCLVLTNVAAYGGVWTLGGGLYACTARMCRIEGNTAREGGGACNSVLESSLVSLNLAGIGSGVSSSTLSSCTIVGNSTNPAGISANTGLRSSSATNCIVYFNGVNYDANCVLRYTCATPLAPGPGNTAANPLIVSPSNPRLMPGSPCIDAGTNMPWMAGTEDWEGDPRLIGTTVDMGVDEFLYAGMTGEVSVAVTAAPLHVSAGYGIFFVGSITGKVQGYRWDFRDGFTTQGLAALTHAYGSDGPRDVLLTASNLSGSATATVQVDVASIAHVGPGGSHEPPFRSWATAATTIQAAVDAAYLGARVLVSNGVYATGGRPVPGSLLTNRLVIDRALPVESVGGPAVTVIEGTLDPFDSSGLGNSAARCVYLVNGALLSGFTIRNGRTRSDGNEFTERSGGGVHCAGSGAVVSNCWMLDNQAHGPGGGVFTGLVKNSRLANNRAQYGGGAYHAVLMSCLVESNYATHGGGMFYGSGVNVRVTGNYAEAAGGGVHGGAVVRSRIEGNQAVDGGGAYAAALYGSLLAGNSAAYGGGARDAALHACTVISNLATQGGGMLGGNAENSIVYFNSAALGPNHFTASLTWSDTSPMPNGSGNIGVDPQLSPTGDPVPLASSPCRDAGQNRSWMFGAADLAGHPRIAAGRVDMGAFEFAPADTDGDGLGDDWEMANFSNLTAASRTSDVDGDRASDTSEYLAGTQPANPASRFEAFLPAPASVTGAARAVHWSSMPGRTYRVERGTNLVSAAPFVVLAAGQVATPAVNTYVDPAAPTNAPLFYRVALEP